ncbi:MAG: hypothetical protein KUG79_18405 [Pseudomonadales bacterium]|nr:hypothetical protein [Pseudomonadales bacterium]
MDSAIGPPSESEWSQIRETMSMLYLSAAQIESSMREGTEAVYSLTDSLVAISHASDQIENSISELNASDQVAAATSQMNSTSLDVARESNQNISVQIKESVIACQFHDRITQRLEHVTTSLSKVCALISAPETYNDPQAWKSLQNEICSGYTMEAERLMFEHIMRGMSVNEALEIYHHNFDDAPIENSDDEIELF